MIIINTLLNTQVRTREPINQDIMNSLDMEGLLDLSIRRDNEVKGNQKREQKSQPDK